MLDAAHAAGGWVLAATFLGVVATILTSRMLRRRAHQLRSGMTTEVAVLVMFAVGAYLASGERIVAVVIGVAVAVLLQFKPELHRFATRLGDDDMRAVMRFALFSGVILPVLPNQTYGPLGVLNPFNIWLMAVLIVGISLGGYIVYKYYGERTGILMGGILGGSISSTATTVSYARRVSRFSGTEQVSAVVIMISSTIVFARVLVEIAIVSPDQVVPLGAPVFVMLLSAALASSIAWLGVKDASLEMPPHSNPTELKPALVFAGLYALVLLALAASERFFPDRGTYAVAFLAGLTDMDAITLSTARMVQNDGAGGTVSPTLGARLILLASLSNLLFKWVIALLIGDRRLGKRLATLFALPAVTGVLLLLI
jgi:uncharacterized membrane protein (DUF4010 family)